MRMYCDPEKVRSQDFDGFTRIQHLQLKKSVLFFVCSLCLCMCSPLAPERLNGFYSCSVFHSSSTLGQFTSMVSQNIPAPKIGTLQMAPKHKMSIFSKNSSYHFD